MLLLTPLLFMVALSPAAGVRLAVAPFDNLSSHPDYDFMKLGMAEALTTYFSQYPQFVVTERSQVNKLVGEHSLQEILGEGGSLKGLIAADQLILGSFQTFKDKLRVDARVVDVATGRVLPDKSVSVSGQSDDVFKLQQKLGTALLSKFGVAVTQEEALTLERSNWELEAYKLFLAGLDFYDRKVKPKAEELFEKAVAKLPGLKDALLFNLKPSNRKKGSKEGVTGLIVDCRGLDVERAPFPKIYSERGEVVYGLVKQIPDFLYHTGTVSYARNKAEAMKRAGMRPLVVKATGVKGVPSVDLVIADKEAKNLSRLNVQDRFLDAYRVAFLIGE